MNRIGGIPRFALPLSIYAVFFCGTAEVRHMLERDRSFNENVAMINDLFLPIVLAIFVLFASQKPYLAFQYRTSRA